MRPDGSTAGAVKSVTCGKIIRIIGCYRFTEVTKGPARSAATGHIKERN